MTIQHTAHWEPYSRLFVMDDGTEWVLAEEARELYGIAQRLGIRTEEQALFATHAMRQSVFCTSRHRALLTKELLGKDVRLGFSYFHGRPGTSEPEFDQTFDTICRYHEQICRIQVSHREIQQLILSSGIDPQKVFLIPIGVNIEFFSKGTDAERTSIRQELGIPPEARVVGSFQKDGLGWDKGMEPKFIKGPDILVKALSLMKREIPGLWVLLSGPARGYVKAGLEAAGIPYTHLILPSYQEVGRLFKASDLYLISSRQEGGPKAIFESMASGVPLVTTRVGQAMDHVAHGVNGWMVEVDDFEGLAHWGIKVLRHELDLEHVLKNARSTAERNSYEALSPRWKDLFKGFVHF